MNNKGSDKNDKQINRNITQFAQTMKIPKILKPMMCHTTEIKSAN